MLITVVAAPAFIITVGACTYLYEAEHPVMEGSGGVIFGQNGTNQYSFNKLLRCHQNVEALATVLHAGLENLSDTDTVHNMKRCKRNSSVIKSFSHIASLPTLI